MLEELNERREKLNLENKAAMSQRAALFHRAFVQSEAGQKILEMYVQKYSMTPIGKPDASMFELGIAEGRRQMIKEIIDHITFVENED